MKQWLRTVAYSSPFLGSTSVVVLVLVLLLGDITAKGFGVLSWSFLWEAPREGMTSGGIFPALVGTLWLTLLTAVCAIPLGVASAVYLSEYAPKTWLTGLIRASIRNLAGIPSVIYGLFGLAVFVEALHLGTSVLSAGLTLGLLSLPYVITTSEEAMRQVPVSLREATLAMGATQYETIRDVVVPQALPGILTGVILSLSRAAGETAPILFTGVAFYISRPTSSPGQEFMALPYHLYMLSTQHQAIEVVRPMAYGTALVLVWLVLLLNVTAFYIRNRSSKNV